MTAYSIIVLITLTALSATALRRAWRRVRTMKDYALLCYDRTGCGQGLGFTGCSAVCCDVESIEQISGLLQQEYDRYEVIVVMDAVAQTDLLKRVVQQFRLIEVNCPTGLELSCEIRHLYRSRQRSFRRLIVVDAPAGSRYDAWSAGVEVSSYEYILPLNSEVMLYPMAIENIAIALCSAMPHRIELLRSAHSPTALFSRNAIVAAGGFSPQVASRIAPSHTLHSNIPICYRTRHTEKIFSVGTTIIALVATLITVTSATINALLVAAIIFTIIVLWLAAWWTAQVTQPRNCSMRDIFYHFREIVNIFPSRKFMIW